LDNDLGDDDDDDGDPSEGSSFRFRCFRLELLWFVPKSGPFQAKAFQVHHNIPLINSQKLKGLEPTNG
jgi:hypothetical protein